MSGIPRSAWVKLYKDLQRAAREFPQYNYREFGRRRIRDYFVANRTVTDAANLSQLYKEGQEELVVITRQATIGKLYPHSKLVVETKKAASA